MPKFPKPNQEQPNTYFVQDRGSVKELERLHLQDQLTTATMGGVLPEQPDPSRFRQVLDVGCGTGGWLIELAKTHPDISLLAGTDVSHIMLAYGREQATIQQVGERVEFHMMDALRRLEFPTGSFDLVNHRFGLSWLRTWDWRALLQEYQRVARPGGVVRITEGDTLVESSSPALLRLNQLSIQALFQAGHFFTSEHDGLTSHLPQLLRQHGLQEVQTRVQVAVHQAGTPQGQRFTEDMKSLYQIILPFLQKWTRVPDDYEDIYQQALREMRQPDFVATGSVLTVWGHVSLGAGQPEGDCPS